MNITGTPEPTANRDSKQDAAAWKAIVLKFHMRRLEKPQQMVGFLDIDRIELLLIPNVGRILIFLLPFLRQISIIQSLTGSCGKFWVGHFLRNKL